MSTVTVTIDNKMDANNGGELCASVGKTSVI